MFWMKKLNWKKTALNGVVKHVLFADGERVCSLDEKVYTIQVKEMTISGAFQKKMTLK